MNDVVQQIKQNLEKLDPETRHRFFNAIKNLKLLDQNTLETVVLVNDMSHQFDRSSMGDNQFLDWLLEHNAQYEIIELSLPDILSLNLVFPGFVRATKLLSGLTRPN